MTDETRTTPGRFLVSVDNLSDHRVFEYQFKDRGVVIERGSAASLRFVNTLFEAFKVRRMGDAP